MAGIKWALVLSFVILLLLSRSPESSASARRSAESAEKTVGPRRQRLSSEDVPSAFQTRKIGIHMKKGGGGGGGHAGGGGGGHVGGGGRVGGGGGGGGHEGDEGHTGGGGHVWPGGGAKPNRGTQRSLAIGSRPSSLASAVCSSLLLGLLFASTIV